MLDRDKEKEHERICKKLGCKPTEVEIPDFKTEDEDHDWVNPFSVLTIEESNFLWENGYFNKQ